MSAEEGDLNSSGHDDVSEEVDTSGSVKTRSSNSGDHNKVPHGDEIRGDKVAGDKVTGDQIDVGDMDDVAGTAIGRGAQAAQVESGKVIQAQRDVITVDSMTIYQQIETVWHATNRQAVRPPDTYVSRSSAEQSLCSLLLAPSDELNVIGLYGLPGVGKTLLGRKVAVGLEDEFPDGTLWADLQTTTTTDALWSFIEPYDPSLSRSDLHSTPQYLEALQRHLAHKKVLIVLDQVESSAQLRELLPRACNEVVALVISRQRLPGVMDESSSVYLSEMKPEEAEALFRAIWREVPRFQSTDSETILSLAEALYFLPASIDAVAHDILNSQVVPADYLANLQRQEGRRDISEPLHNPGFEAVYHNLPPLGRQLLPFLGVLGGGIWSLDALAVVSQEKSRDAQLGLRQLLASGLVHLVSPGQFGVSPIARDFALAKLRELGGESLMRVSQSLMANHYLNVAQQNAHRYRQWLLDDFLADESRKQRFLDGLIETLSSSGIADERGSLSRLAKVAPGLTTFDLIQDTFERVVLADLEFAQRWSQMLNSGERVDHKRQLENALGWALEREDWPFLQRLAMFDSGAHILDVSVVGHKKGDWATIQFDFALVRELSVVDIQVVNTSFKATRMVDSQWVDCEFVSVTWPGAHLHRTKFVNVDMVGAKMPGIVATRVILADVDARNADLRGAIFYMCKLSDVKFRNADLEGAEFLNCKFSNVDFRGTVFGGLTDTGVLTGIVTGRIMTGDLDVDMIGPYETTDVVVDRLFEDIYRLISTRPEDPKVDKEELTEIVRKIQGEVARGEEANPHKVERWLKTLAGMADDIFEVTVACLTSPAAGIATVIRKVAQKAKEEAA
jgi:hypothetical protein